MKKLFFVLALLFMFAENAHSAIVIYNNKPCPIRVNIRFLSVSGGVCTDIGGTNVYVGSMGTSPNIYPPVGTGELEIAVNLNGNTPPPLNIGVLGLTGLCGGWPNSGSRSGPCGFSTATVSGTISSCSITVN